MYNIQFDKNSKSYNLTNNGTKSFSNITKDQLDEFKVLKEDLDHLDLSEYSGRYDRLLFRNQPKAYFIYFPPKSGGGAPHIEIRVHPDSTYNFTEFFDPFKYNGNLRVKLNDRRFKELYVSHSDYDLLSTYFCMEIQHSDALRLSGTEVELEDKKTTFDKIVEIMNTFDDKFYFNDLKKVFPLSKLNEYYLSKVGNGSKLLIRFLRGMVRLTLAVNKKPVLLIELTTKGEINLLLDENNLKGVIGSEADYKDTLDSIFNSGRYGFNKLNVEFIDTDEAQNSTLAQLFTDYSEKFNGPKGLFKIK